MSKKTRIVSIPKYVLSIVFVYFLPFITGVAQTFPTSRDPFLWPFTQTSIWNMPIGSGAVYQPAGLKKVSTMPIKNGGRGGIGVDDEPIIVAQASDPNYSVWGITDWSYRCNNSTNLNKTVKMPAGINYPPPNGSSGTPNFSGVAVQPDGSLFHFNAIATCGNNKISVYDYSEAENSTLKSTGYYGGHGGSVLSGIGGAIRKGELLSTEPIRHAIKINVWAEYCLSYVQDGTPGYRWPAKRPDGYANGVYGTLNSNIPAYTEMGALLAIRPEVTPQSIGITNPIVIKIFNAMKDYGAYIVDDTYWPHYDLPLEEGVPEEVEAATGTQMRSGSGNPYFEDMMKVIEALQVVTNNGPNSIGGGGTPRQPLAPPFIGTTIISVSGITLSPITASISVGSSQVLTATITPTDATNKNVTWSSSNTAIATVNNQGLVTGVGVGTATITAISVDGNKSASSSITVSTTSPCSNPITYKIMPIGDSKTEGGGLSGNQSWRGYLRAKLIQNNFSMGYVGNSNYEAGGDPTPHDYDHEGHGGYTIGPDIQRWCPTCETTGIIDHIDSWLQPVSPDIIILSIGINDFFNSDVHPANYQATAVQRYQDLVNKILILKPNAKLVVCTIEPVKWDQNWGGTDGSDLAKLNDKIRQIANASTTDNIYLADLRADFLLTYSAADFYDDVHLSTQGATKTANTIYNTLQSIMPCGQGAVIPITSLTLNPTTVSISVGTSQALTATITPTDATNKNVTWSSSNTAIATVNNQGLVTGVGIGTATITATSVDGNKSASSSITVTASTSTVAYAEDFTDNLAQGWQGSTNLAASNQVICSNTTSGEEIAFYNSQSFSNYTYKVKATPQWNNSFGVVFNYQDATNYYVLVLEVATKNALIKKMQAGTLTTLATSTYTGGGAGVLYSIELTNTPTTTSVLVNGGSVFTNTPTIDFTSGKIGLYTFYNPVCFDDIEVSVQAGQTAVTGVSITPTAVSLTKGQTSQLTATVAPSTAANKAVTFTSSNTTVATVSASGLVTAIAPGTSTITVSTQDGNKTATAAITVTNTNPVVTITSPTTNTTKCVGESISITATASDADGSVSKVEFYEGTTIIGTSSVAPYTAMLSNVTVGTKTITAKAYDNLTGMATSTAVTVTVNANPTASISTTTATTFCQGASVVLTASGGSSYKWMNGTTQVGTAATYSASIAGSYTVEVTNAGGCKATSTVTTVTVNATTTWYADADGDGKGDATQTLSACAKPNGYVAVAGDACPTDANKIAPGNCGCNNTETSCLDCAGVANGSAVLDNCSICVGGTTGKTACVTTGIATANATTALKIAPQPFDASTTISMEDGSMIESITVMSSDGAIVFTQSNIQSKEVQLGESLASGLYLVQVNSSKGIYVSRIVKK